MTKKYDKASTVVAVSLAVDKLKMLKDKRLDTLDDAQKAVVDKLLTVSAEFIDTFGGVP